MIKNKKKFWLEIGKAILKITLAAIFIGYFHQYDTIIAALLTTKGIHSVYDLVFKNGQRNWLIIYGMLITGAVGIIAEFIGVTYNFWEYHDTANHLPNWLIIAWMLSFCIIYKFERNLFETFRENSLKNKLIGAFFIAFILPIFGEVITINLGVWTYHIPHQFIGIPLVIFLGLPFIHLGINTILFFINKKYQLNDAVFSVESN